MKIKPLIVLNVKLDKIDLKPFLSVLVIKDTMTLIILEMIVINVLNCVKNVYQ